MGYMALIANFGYRKPVVVEIGDIRELQVKKGLLGKIIRTIDNYLINKCSLLIVTAPDFLNEYYKKWLNINITSLIMENKLEDTVTNTFENKKKVNNKKIRIGYFGLIRCLGHLKFLKVLQKKIMKELR